MKKILFLLFAVLLPAMAEAYDACIDGIYYNFDKEAKTATVTFLYKESSSNRIAYSGTVNIPSTVIYHGETYNVMNIGDQAFEFCSGLTSVTIPNSVTCIGYDAFNKCSGLTSVTIGNSVTSIGEGAFGSCSGLSSVAIPNSVTSIGNWAFDHCTHLVSVTIGNRVTSIGNWAFYECRGLTSVYIPNSVKSIGNAFYGCSGLTSINVEEGNTVYDSRNNCNAIIETETNNLITGCINTLIPNSVTSIGDRAFSLCNDLTSIKIPNSVTSIGDYAFFYCSGLTSVTIPNSVTSIGDYAFDGCSGLTSITIPNSVTSIGQSAFCNCNGLTSVTISSGVTTIKSGTFYGCSKLSSMTIPSSVTSIEDGSISGASYSGAFAKCSSLLSITIPNSVRRLGNYTFRECSSLASITIPSSVTSIGHGVFSYCSGLTSVTIPHSVKSIEEFSFYGCSSLTSVTALPETPPTLYDNSFSDYNIPLCASKTAIGAYQTTEPWSRFAQFLIIEGEQPQCATPTIDFANWKVTFNCETEGAEIVTKAVCSDTQEGDGGAISLMPTYTITAYAKAEGYRDSDVATATIGWKNGRPVIIQGFSNVSLSDYGSNCDTNLDGTIDVADIATIIDAMAAQAREQVDLEE